MHHTPHPDASESPPQHPGPTGRTGAAEAAAVAAQHAAEQAAVLAVPAAGTCDVPTGPAEPGPATPAAPEPGPLPRPLPVGTLAHDMRRERRGTVMDHLAGQVWLRPPGGGTEWTARPADVVPVNGDRVTGGSLADDAVLRARVALANARSRGELL